MHLTSSNFTLFAACHYDNPSCIDEEEFRQDLDRFKHLKRAFRRYESTGDINIQWTINQLVTIFNVWPAGVCNQMMVLKFENVFHILKPFLLFLGHWPQEENTFACDPSIVGMLREFDGWS